MLQQQVIVQRFYCLEILQLAFSKQRATLTYSQFLLGVSDKDRNCRESFLNKCCPFFVTSGPLHSFDSSVPEIIFHYGLSTTSEMILTEEECMCARVSLVQPQVVA